MNYKVLESRETYKGKILKMTLDKLEMPDGTSAYRETVIRSKNAGAVLPVDNDGKIIFVRQYRHAFGEMLLEIPAGVIDGSETTEACILRELEEETGKKAGRVEFICEIYPTVGFLREKIGVFFACNLTDGVQKLDKDEFLEIEKYTIDEAIDMIYKGDIKDGKTIAALFAYKCRNK